MIADRALAASAATDLRHASSSLRAAIFALVAGQAPHDVMGYLGRSVAAIDNTADLLEDVAAR